MSLPIAEWPAYRFTVSCEQLDAAKPVDLFAEATKRMQRAIDLRMARETMRYTYAVMAIRT